MKRLVSIILILLLAAAMLPPSAAAAHVSAYEAADALAALGLLRGTEHGYELERAGTRAEATAMLLRLLGEEAAAQAETGACPFDDGGWAAPLLTYAWKNGLVNGQSARHFGSKDTVGARDWATMLLRVLGYSDADGDFSWRESLAFADSVGLTHGEYTAHSDFLREDLVLLSYTALTLRMKNSERTLAEKLYLDGVLSGAALAATRLSAAASADKPVYDAMQIHELGASAVLYVEAYRDESSLQKDKPDSRGSAFFITGDGVAVLCYHELDGMAYARVRTLDGHRYDVAAVLAYDPLWDVAVVRVSRTDLDGNTVRFFPYLDLGDSDALTTGEPVYTISNALGLVDSISAGILSNRARNVDDPDYLSLQIDAAISQGSSGGALLNRHGEVIGVLFGGFVSGENMNLAVPINVVAACALSDDGVSLAEVKETMDEKKAAATLSISQTELNLEYGEEVELVVTHTAPTQAAIQYFSDGHGVVKCTWGAYQTKYTVPLTIEAVGDGEATVTISFADDNGSEEYYVDIHVTVTGAPEKLKEAQPDDAGEE